MKLLTHFQNCVGNRKHLLYRVAAFSAVLLILNINLVCAQGKLTGFVVDDEFNMPLEKAVITIPGTLISVLTDQQGKYVLKMRAGDYFMEVNYPGYFGRKYNMSVVDEITSPMFIIKLKPDKVGEDLQQRLASKENKREFPQSIEDFSIWQMTEQNGNQEFNELLRRIPSVTFHGNGSGFDDSDIGFRGNDPTRTSYTYNGILLNNPENGRVNSSMLSGLTDWAGNMQVTSGQAANLQSQTAFGALVNVQSTLPREKGGVDLLTIYGNNGFLKTSATIHSGYSKKRPTSMFQVSRTVGDGLVQNSAFGQYSFLANFHREFNQFHTLDLSLNATLQKYDRNFADSIGNYNLYETKYNRNWGLLGAKTFSWSTNYSRSPLLSLTHFWKPRIKTRITTQLFAAFNRSAQLLPGGNPLNGLPRDLAGHLLFDRISIWNKGLDVPELGGIRQPDANGAFVNTETSGVSTMASIDKETRFGIRSVMTREVNKKLDVSSSLNFDYYKANHFGAVSNLMGAESFLSYADVNRPAGFPVENLFQPKFVPSYNSADKAGWNFHSGIQTLGAYFRVNYQLKRYLWFFEGAASVQNISRTDLFNYLNSDADRLNTSLLPGGRAQAGVRINLWKYHSVHFKLNYGSYQPLFTTLYPSINNWKNTGAKNKQVFQSEFGYTIFSRKLKVEALAYYSQIANHSVVRNIIDDTGNSIGLINGVAEIHQGVELKTSYKITKNFQLSLNGSLGDWKYSKDAKAQIFGADNQQTSENELWLKGIRIGNAPQLSLFAEAEYRWAHNFYFRINYYRAEQVLAPFGLNDFKNLTARRDFKQWQMPKYDLVGISGNYLLQYRKLPDINLIFGGQNLLDTEYIEQSFANIPEGNSAYTSNQVYYGMGRTWFVGLKVQF